MAAIPAELFDRLEAAEIFHQLLEHRSYLSERRGTELEIRDVIDDYLRVLEDAPAERLHLDTTLT